VIPRMGLAPEDEVKRLVTRDAADIHAWIFPPARKQLNASGELSAPASEVGGYRPMRPRVTPSSRGATSGSAEAVPSPSVLQGLDGRPWRARRWHRVDVTASRGAMNQIAHGAT
jgi:hypothetical protein